MLYHLSLLRMGTDGLAHATGLLGCFQQGPDTPLQPGLCLSTGGLPEAEDACEVATWLGTFLLLLTTAAASGLQKIACLLH